MTYYRPPSAGVYSCGLIGADQAWPRRFVGVAGDRTLASALAKLQWGRDQLIAEMWSGKARQGKDKQLQWGRDQLIAEMSLNE